MSGIFKHESTTQPGLFFWAEPVGFVPGWHIVSQVDGFDATEAHDDWFATKEGADEVAEMLAKGTYYEGSTP